MNGLSLTTEDCISYHERNVFYFCKVSFDTGRISLNYIVTICMFRITLLGLYREP